MIPYSDQQLSATFGGPILRDRFHYFGSFEYEREPQTYIYNTPYPYFNGSLTGTRTEKKGIARLDYQFSPQMRLSVRGSRYQNMLPYDPRYTGGATRTMASAIGTHRRSEQLLVTLTQVIGNRATNMVKAGHDLFHWNQFAHVKNANSLPGQTAGLGAPVITLRGSRSGQSHQLTPQDIGEQVYTRPGRLRSLIFEVGTPRPAEWGPNTCYNFLFETVCNGCMGNYDLQGARDPAVDHVELGRRHPRCQRRDDVEPRPALAARTPVPAAGLRWIRRHIRGRPAAGGSRNTRPVTRCVLVGPGRLADFAEADAEPRAPVRLAKSTSTSTGSCIPPFLLEPRPQDTNNFGPRVGFAYSLDDRTVLRGGAGKYYAEVTEPVELHAADGAVHQPAGALRRARGLQLEPVQRSGADLRSGFAAPLCRARGRRLPAAEHRQHGGGRSPAAIQLPGVARRGAAAGQRMSFEADYIVPGEPRIHAERQRQHHLQPRHGRQLPVHWREA